ncbi:MAG: hypothetical protein J2P45_27670, partial [Candidatus Dormibacteraeota bacterium]|nr:hypothetical protein [Candidatus Dormibacteraeota bacterium]
GRDVDAEALLSGLLPRMRPALQGPLFVKVPPYRTDAEREGVLRLVRIAEDGGADGVTASNTLPVPAAEMWVGRGGLSGRAIFGDTVRIVDDISEATQGRLLVNACGGIFSAEDAIRCLQAGARTVQLYTGLIYRGPRVVREIGLGLLRSGVQPLPNAKGTGTGLPHSSAIRAVGPSS